MAAPHPVILCGKTEVIGAVVIESLKPEFEVIHFIQTVSTGKAIIPSLLRGEAPNPSSSTSPISSLGTKNYSRPPVAVLLGAAFDDEGVKELMEAAKGTKDVPWLRPDTSKPAPPPGPEYGQAMVKRIKEAVRGLEERGELVGNGGIVWF
ncbi:hypothetical protein BU25DRAFT_417281 [Macroventuria anomochaeta]|uniref:Uncharacterized protein n=1 Tax=Macroventuria anomochaeta TaxID=301207 RepID=A0ACB6SH52_9PLEO|nr:uncharacterized protein BU25DRAFT_417281 [Macroventuria anomochaeta]KAF2632678.1 hypothetical protein BU25DRAFT_417281 [Macroventuria anomochaeta]